MTQETNVRVELPLEGIEAGVRVAFDRLLGPIAETPPHAWGRRMRCSAARVSRGCCRMASMRQRTGSHWRMRHGAVELLPVLRGSWTASGSVSKGRRDQGRSVGNGVSKGRIGGVSPLRRHGDGEPSCLVQLLPAAEYRGNALLSSHGVRG